MAALLAVDVGLHTGLALFGDDGRLQWARSNHVASAARLRDAAPALLRLAPDATHLVFEGGGELADIWRRAGERRSLICIQVSAEVWRPAILFDRERRNGPLAKQHADRLARNVYLWSGLKPPKNMRDDMAEAILVGLWGLLQIGWLDNLPEPLRRP
jgi:hypothetical protein